MISIDDAIDYEIKASWWASWIGWEWGQTLAGKYFAWKVQCKYARYKWFCDNMIKEKQ